MNTFLELGFDPQLCNRICLTLAHSLWQVSLLAACAFLLVSCLRRDKPERGYSVYVGAMLLAIVALPITYWQLGSDSLVVNETLAAANETGWPTQSLEVLPPTEIVKPRADSEPVSSAPAIVSNQAVTSFGFAAFAPWLLGVYLLGVVAMLLRVGQGVWKAQRLASLAQPLSSGPLVAALERLARSWSLRVLPRLAEAQHIIVPQVVGLLRPTILIPTSALTGLTPGELEMILAHELAHVRRHDMWVNLLQRLAEAVLFFNPALWYLSRQISIYREYCCDEQTCRGADQSSPSRVQYAQALLRIVELSGQTDQRPEIAALAASGGRPSELRRRVARLFGEPLREPIRVSRSGLLALVIGLGLMAVAPLSWQNAAEPVKDEEQPVAAGEQSAKPKVEVLAIGTHDEEPQRWWNAEGENLESVPFTWSKGSTVASPDKVWRRIAIRVDVPSEDDADMTWNIIGARASAGGNLVFDGEHQPGIYRTRYFGLDENQKTIGLRVGVARGKWNTVAETSGSGSSASGLMGGKSIVFSSPMASAEGTTIIISHNFFDVAFRIVAIDKQGKTHDTAGRGGYSAGQIYQSPATFRGLKPDQIERFEFQTRDYEWTEIDDLPMEPGKLTSKNPSASEPIAQEAEKQHTDDNDKAKIASLEELIASYEAIYQRINVLYDQGLAGGEPANKWLAYYHLSIARAELATAKGEGEPAVEQYQEAVKAAGEVIKAQQTLYDVGRVTVEAVLEARKLRAKAQVLFYEAKKRNSQSEIADEIYIGDLTISKQNVWITRLNHLIDHNPTAFSVGPQMIADLSPPEAWQVVQTVWPEIDIDEVKTGLLKTFEFARHPKVLKVLDLGATDESEFVRDYAYSYLQNYALRDFKKPEHEYQSWRSENAQKTIDEVLAANCQWFVDQLRSQPPITDPMAWQEMEMMLEISGSKSSYPVKAEYLIKAGLPAVLRSWRDDAQLDDRMKRQITTFLGKLEKTLDDSLSYINVDLSGRNLEGISLLGNVDSLFMNANLSKTDLSNATLVGGAKAFYETNFSEANLKDAVLIGRAALQKANLSGANLENTLVKSGVSGLQEANFDDAVIQGARIHGSMQLATFRRARIADTRFEGIGPAMQMSNFEDAQLTTVTLIGTSFQAVSLNNTQFQECDLSTVRANDLASSKFETSTPPRYDAATKFPEGFDPADHGWQLIE